MKVYIIGSISQTDEIVQVAKEYELMGLDVRYVKKEDGYLKDLINNTFSIIKSWADLIIVVPKEVVNSKFSFGEGTMYEIEFAKFCNVPVLIHYK